MNSGTFSFKAKATTRDSYIHAYSFEATKTGKKYAQHSHAFMHKSKENNQSNKYTHVLPCAYKLQK